MYEYKGGHTAVRCKTICITCPRPPKSVEIDGEYYEGEFRMFDRAQNSMVPFEDVDQVVARIRESGGKIILCKKVVGDRGFLRDSDQYTAEDVTELVQ